MSFIYSSRQLLLHCSTSCIHAVDPNPLPARERGLKKEQGFTLLEMVLVLLIMGMVASLSVVFIDNEDGQLRYEESVRKLEAMYKATVADYKDGSLYSGFIVDNGTLPNSAKEFVSIPTDWIQYGETYNDTEDPLNPVVKSRLQPYYRLTEENLNTALDNPYKAFTLDDPNAPRVPKLYLKKGYRPGYISIGVDSDRDYKDGWGTDFIVGIDNDDPAPSPETNTASYQDFELALNEPETAPNERVNRNVTKDNWSVALTDIVIEVQNNRTGPNDDITNAIIGISVFKNKAFIRPVLAGDDSEICQDCWVTYHIKRKCESTNKNPISISANSFITVSTEQDYIWQTEALSQPEHGQDDCVHAQNVDKKNAMKVRIPAGEHIVFVGDDGVGADTVLEPSEIRAIASLRVTPRSQPIIDPLEIND